MWCGPSFEALPGAAGGGLQVAGVQPELEAVLVTLPAVTIPPQQGLAPCPHPRHRGVILGLGVGVAAQPATTTTSVDTVILNANNNHYVCSRAVNKLLRNFTVPGEDG